MLRGDRVAQQVAMGEKKFAVASRRDLISVADVGKLAVASELACEHRGKLGAGLGVASLQRDQDEARTGTVAQLVHEQLLPRSRSRRQEGGKIGDIARIEGGPCRQGNTAEPCSDGPCPAGVHGAG